jgi:hypothetical protein
MSTIAITPQLKVSMLKHLVAGKDLDFVAQVTRVPRDTVLDIVSAHGYPDVDKMSWAVDILIKTVGKIPESHLRTGTPLDPPAPAARVNNHATGVNGSAGFAVIAPATGQPTTHPTHTGELLSRAAQSPFMRTQNLGAKISALLTDLTARLDDEEEARNAKVKADREAAAVATRIAQLQAEIDKLKRKTPKVAKTTGVSKATKPVLTGEFSCTMDSCDRRFDTSQGVALHQRRAHEGWNPRTVNAA